MDFDMYDEDVGLPASFLARLQPAGAFLNQQCDESMGLQSPTSVAQYQSSVAAVASMTPRSVNAKSLLHPAVPATKADQKEVAMSFMSAMRRGLDGLSSNDSDDDDDDEDEDEDDTEGYYQPSYSQYHAPTSSFTGRSCVASDPSPPSKPTKAKTDEDDLIFPMEL